MAKTPGIHGAAGSKGISGISIGSQLTGANFGHSTATTPDYLQNLGVKMTSPEVISVSFNASDLV